MGGRVWGAREERDGSPFVIAAASKVTEHQIFVMTSQIVCISVIKIKDRMIFHEYVGLNKQVYEEFNCNFKITHNKIST
jgi:hypothetical protein